MSNFTTADVRQLARLARLQLTVEEEVTFTQQLGDILRFARQIEAVDTTMGDAVENATPVPLREDELRPSLDRNEVLAGAPDADARTGLIKVPRVLNG